MTSANYSPDISEAAVIEVHRGGRAIPLTIHYTAIREAREFVATVPGATSGLIFGTYTPDELAIKHVAGPAAQQPIGFFRVQSGGWPALLETDRQRMLDLAPSGGLVLVLRTLHQRPWPATLFVVEPLAPAVLDLPVAEFPFDEYLLRNGWLTDLAPPLPPEPRPSQKFTDPRLFWGVAAALLIAASGAVAYRWLPLPLRTISSSPSTSADREAAVPDMPAPEGTNLGLKVSPTASHLELSWNRHAAAVRQATSGTVFIRNGPVARVLPLNPEQLRGGRILYLPMSGADVDIRLEVVTAGGRTEAESVQLISFNTSPAFSMPLTPLPPAPRQPSAAAASQEEADPEPPVLHRAVKPFRADALTPQPTKSAANAAPETPAVAAPGVAEVNLRGIAATAAPAPPPAPAANPGLPPGGHLEDAQLISGHAPEYPRLAREARILGTVELEITIGADGRVKNARALKGDPRLKDAALTAVRQWVYRPTMLNGKPIESQRQIVLNFKP